MKHQIIYTENAPEPIGPYSQAILANGTLYASGQIAINPANGEYVNATITEETRQIFKNLEAVLLQANLSFKEVVKVSVFLKDMDNFSEMNDVYSSVFSETKPARETVEVSRLPKDVNVEISLIASAQ